MSGAALIGSNIGPNLTPYGSLATMLVLGEAQRRGIEIRFIEILRTGLLVTPFVLLAATAALVLTASGHT